MPDAIVERQVTVTLTLSEAEAKWLKIIMQNPFNCRSYEDEPMGDRQMRESFWNALETVKTY